MLKIGWDQDSANRSSTYSQSLGKTSLMHTTKSIHIKHIISTCSDIQDQIQRTREVISTEQKKNLSRVPPFLSIFNAIHEASDRISEKLSQKGATAADLPVRSRRGYQWLTWLKDPDHFQTHLQTLHRLYTIKDQLHPHRVLQGKRTTIHLYLIGPLYRIRRQKEGLTITAHESFIAAKPHILRSLIQYAFQQDQEKNRKTIQEFTTGESYRQTRERMEYIAIPHQATTQGTYKDLLPVFRSVNQAYFEGALLQPHLVWSDRLTYRKFGHYRYETDTIMISRSLDDPQLLDCALAYVIYHELLHKALGFQEINGRRQSHTKTFREKEKMFKDYKKAQSILEHLSQKLS
jgi:hypothetical protein